ncbi:hypothetical protein KDA23_05875 [Candidatus Saccharibacteria bacterium]|nr:hypothetical protein [Candidatus Saccharibacteria bacterium]
MATLKAVNQVAIDELRRSNAKLDKAVDQLRVKTLTFIAAGFALLTYLYKDGNLFIPVELYGRIFYFVGLASILSALILFLLGLRPYPWMLTTEIKQLKKIPQRSENQYLEYVKGEYISCFEKNGATYEIKHRSFNLGFILLILGASILVVIKTFPGRVQSCYTGNGITCIVVSTKKEGMIQ